MKQNIQNSIKVFSEKRLDNASISYSNILIENPPELSPAQWLILDMLSTAVNPVKDIRFYTYAFPTKLMAKIIDYEGDDDHGILARTTDSLLSKVLVFRNNKGKRIAIHLIEKVEIDESAKIDGCVYISLSPEMAPLLLGLTKKNKYTDSTIGYTTIKFKDVERPFKNKYTRVYFALVLKEHRQGRERYDEVDSLKAILTITHNKFKRYCDFKARVLDSVKEDISTKTQYNCEIIEVKEGRNVIGLRSRLIEKKDAVELLPQLSPVESMNSIEAQPELDDRKGIKEKLEVYPIDEKNLQEILEYPDKKILEGIKFVEWNDKLKPDYIEDYGDFLSVALRKRWGITPAMITREKDLDLKIESKERQSLKDNAISELKDIQNRFNKYYSEVLNEEMNSTNNIEDVFLEYLGTKKYDYPFRRSFQKCVSNNDKIERWGNDGVVQSLFRDHFREFHLKETKDNFLKSFLERENIQNVPDLKNKAGVGEDVGLLEMSLI